MQSEEQINGWAFVVPEERMDDDLKTHVQGARLYVVNIDEKGEYTLSNNLEEAFKVMDTGSMIHHLMDTFAKVNGFELVEVRGALKESQSES